MAKSFQKKVLDNDLWIDRNRLLWVKKMGEKKFRAKNYFGKAKNTTEIIDVVRRREFAMAYTAIFFNIRVMSDEMHTRYDRKDIEKYWPDRITQQDLTDYIKMLGDGKGFDNAVGHTTRGIPLRGRKFVQRFFPFGAPDPELTNPIADVAKLLENNYQLLNFARLGTEIHATLPNAPHFIEIEKVCYLQDFERIMSGMVAMELMLGETELFLLDSDTAYDLLNAEDEIDDSSQISSDELNVLPFKRFYIEFDRPIEIEGLETTGIGFYTHTENTHTMVLFHATNRKPNLKGWGWYKEQKSPIQSPPYNSYTALHMINVGSRDRSLLTLQPEEVQAEAAKCYVGLVTTHEQVQKRGLREIQEHEVVSIKALRVLAKNLRLFLLCRNINYDKQRRPPFKPNLAIHGYTHRQGEQANLNRDYRLIKINRTVKPYGTGHKATELAFRVHMPAVFRRLVYCKECGDLHRHDLKGQPCRKCGKTVGPHKNIDIHEIYIPSYWKGPEDAPIQKHARHLTRKPTKR